MNSTCSYDEESSSRESKQLRSPADLKNKSICSILNELSYQTFTELVDNYAHCFEEIIKSCDAKHAANTASFQSIITEKIEATKSWVEFTKFANSELEISNDKNGMQPFQKCQNYFNKRIDEDTNFEPRVVFSLNRFASQSTSNCNHLLFDSRFEGGNMRKVYQIGGHHYQIILSPDYNNTSPNYHWFFFEVSNNEADVAYTFEIVSCSYKMSVFSHGMQPVIFSVKENSLNGTGWFRDGSSICFYQNEHCGHTISSKRSLKTERRKYSSQPKKRHANTNCFCVQFELVFQHIADVCYIAYHYPYTFSRLQASLEYIASNSSELVYTRRNNLCSTLAGNLVPIVTVTATESQIPIHEREFVVFSARVHPGECNSSWIMQGIIEYLHSSEPKAIKLREYFIFKLIPMLNPDGVIHGNSRFNLAGVDLNRVWDSPQEQIHPTVYHTKGVIQYMVDILKKRPLLFVDIHGHSKLSNIFLYGTSADRLLDSDDNSPGSGSTSICLSRILSDTLEGFCLSNCKFHVSKSKKGTARAVLKHQFGVQMSYTLETSFYGFHSGMYAGSQLSIDKLKQIGHVLCDALLLLREEIMMTEVMSTSR